KRRIAIVIAALVMGGALTGAVFSAAGGVRTTDASGQGLWRSVPATLPAVHDGAKPDVQATRLDAFKLDQAGIQPLLQLAPPASPLPETELKHGIVVKLPDPKGGFQRFLLAKSDLMAPGLQAKHPEIGAFAGRGIDDPKATIHADLSPLGFHASVRSPK